jgi:hypothetical protein
MIPHQDDVKEENENITIIESLDSDLYDTEAARIDESNGNFSPQNVEDYLCTNIVLASLTNGQRTQAREQCASYGLDYSEMVSQSKLNN